MTRKAAYLCLQATSEGQASHAHVHEIRDGLRSLGWDVDLFEPSYAHGAAPGALGRIREFGRVQRRLIRELPSYDIVYIRAHQLAYRSALAAHRLGIPVVQECNGTFADLVAAWPAAAPAAGPLNALQRRQYRLASAVIAVTPGLARWVEDVSGNSHTFVVPNGANIDLFRPDAPRPAGLPKEYVVFFGSLTPWAGIETLLSAVHSARWPGNLPLVIVGSGALSPIVEAAAASDTRIIALGTRPYAEVGGIVAGSSVSIVPTDPQLRPDADPSPVKLYESMAAGVPVVVSDTLSQAREVVDTGAGTTFATGHADSLAAAVAFVVEDERRSREMGRAGRETAVREHSWAVRALRTSEILERALKGMS